MIQIEVHGSNAVIRKNGTLTCGMVGAPISFVFDEAWDGLVKTAVFSAGGITKDVVGIGDVAAVPHEVLKTPGIPLRIGVYGESSDGSVVIPTVWVKTDLIAHGTTPSGDPSTNPTPGVWEQMLAMIGTLDDLELDKKDNLVEAINDVILQMISYEDETQKKDLAVTISEDFSEASHSSDEIMQHIQSDGHAYIDYFGAGHFPFVFYADGKAYFGALLTVEGETMNIALAIDENKAITPFEAQLVSTNSLPQFIPTALPNPCSLNINGTYYNGMDDVVITIPRGEDGADGITPHIGSNGNWYLGAEDTGVNAEGSDGKDGSNGTNGKDGADGLTPYIGANGNWFIGNTDTGTKAAASSSSGGHSYAELVDDIEITEEGLTEISLELDLSQCYEARLFCSVPANGTGTNYSFFLVTGDGIYQNSLCSLSSLSASLTGSYFSYKAITESLGEVTYGSGMSNADVTDFDKIGGMTNLIVPKAPRTIHPGLRAVSDNKNNFTFPVGTRIFTYAWKR